MKYEKEIISLLYAHTHTYIYNSMVRIVLREISYNNNVLEERLILGGGGIGTS